MYEEKPSLLTNKKFLIAAAAVITITVIVILIFGTTNINPNNDTIETDSSSVEDYYYDTEEFAYTEHPISHYLPIINDDPYFCLSYDVSGSKSEGYSFKLTIEYNTEEGKTAAEDLLKSQFSTYTPSNYEIIYTKIEE
ncbi:hypothetical protein IKG31_00160 [Candidatus Saccharibacteria bacterium]|nr:hypothetical protein [Candidatus Saccharibacteria bacterium]